MSDTGSDPAYNSEAANRGISLLLLPAASVVALVPAWTVLCGALAAHDGRRPLQSALDPHALIALVLVVFIVQVLWSTGQALLIEGDRTRSARGGASKPPPPSGPRHGMPRLPYITPWSPLRRLGRLWPTSSQTPSDRLTLVLVPLLTFVLSAVTGWQLIVLSLAAAALSVIEWRVARQGHASRALQAGTLVGLGWLAGHTILAPLTWPSLVLACCYAIAYQGALELDRDDTFARKTTSPAQGHRLPWALTLLYGGQGAALVLLVVLERPLAATLAGMLLAPQWLLLAQLDPSAPGTWPPYIRRAIPFVMVAILVSAWTIPA